MLLHWVGLRLQGRLDLHLGREQRHGVRRQRELLLADVPRSQHLHRLVRQFLQRTVRWKQQLHAHGVRQRQLHVHLVELRHLARLEWQRIVHCRRDVPCHLHGEAMQRELRRWNDL